MTKTRLLVAFAAVALVLASVAGGAVLLFDRKAQEERCSQPYRDDVRIRTGSGIIQAQVADDDEERMLGLGGRACIGESQGMLFVYPEPGVHAYWMKGMRFAIDIVWLGADKRVVKVDPEIQASNPGRFTAGAVMYVLELKAGRAQELGLRSGSRLQFGER